MSLSLLVEASIWCCRRLSIARPCLCPPAISWQPASKHHSVCL